MCALIKQFGTKRQGWVGFDLDGTLAIDTPGTWPQIGDPIPAMCDRLRWLNDKGIPCRIITARVSAAVYPDKVVAEMARIDAWCLAVFGCTFQLTPEKDQRMMFMFDDRAIHVPRNSGEILWESDAEGPLADLKAGSQGWQDVLSSPIPQTVPDILRSGAETFEERAATYGTIYKDFGKVLKGLFPNGITLNTEEDFTRFGLLSSCASKLNRYCGAMGKGKGGHQDSAHDLSVYAAMLEEQTK